MKDVFLYFSTRNASSAGLPWRVVRRGELAGGRAASAKPSAKRFHDHKGKGRLLTDEVEKARLVNGHDLSIYLDRHSLRGARHGIDDSQFTEEFAWSLGIALPVIERLLAHRSGSFAGIVGVYQHYTYEKETRAAIELWETHILKITGHAP